MRILVTGGAGFIGSAFIRLAAKTLPEWKIWNFDKLTYAGNLENLKEIEDHSNYSFIRGDIADAPAVGEAFALVQPDAVIHFAAESHVDRSILSPEPVIRTNLNGTFCLLEAARKAGTERFLHVSTDEVYGSIDDPLEADESYPLRASSPYSSSKAGSDLLALSYFTTYKMPVMVTRASNNYGPCQFPEKLIPLMIANAREDRPLPVYGDGMQIRDWLFVDDHCRALMAVLGKGLPGEVYNIGGSLSLPNVEVIRRILKIMDKPESLMRQVADRPGHDRRYALNSEKLTAATGWRPQVDFQEGLRLTVDWYASHADWLQNVRSGEYRNYYDSNYAERLKA